MKVVLDTNVLISSLINPNGNPAKILNLLLAGRLTLLFDNRILFEYIHVLKREKFGFSDDVITPFIDFIKNEGIYVHAEPLNISFPDIDDKKFYEVFKSGQADYLITGNLIHFPKEINLLNPTNFLLKTIQT
jgi:putative PIN family toxin of toxin-antitoxin system